MDKTYAAKIERVVDELKQQDKGEEGPEASAEAQKDLAAFLGPFNPLGFSLPRTKSAITPLLPSRQERAERFDPDSLVQVADIPREGPVMLNGLYGRAVRKGKGERDVED
eukprot:scaffold6133_cov105-Pinguiococcus_pyrenoidosus.AAC.1